MILVSIFIRIVIFSSTSVEMANVLTFNANVARRTNCKNLFPIVFTYFQKIAVNDNIEFRQ